MGLFKKLKETAEKGIEKGVELGTKGYDSAKDAAKKGYDKAKEERMYSEQTSSTTSLKDLVTTKSKKNFSPKETKSRTADTEEMRILKIRLAKGDITKEEFEEMKKMLSS